jgi:hypothetical protein
MVGFTVPLPAKWEQFLKRLADDHQIDLNALISELCEWAFSDSEGKEQFESWLDDSYPSKGKAEDKASSADEEIAEKEEAEEEESEEEAHEDENYNEDIAGR